MSRKSPASRRKAFRASRVTLQSSTGLAEPLQQVDRTHVLYRGRKLAYFAGCDYFRLSSDPAVMRAVHDGLERFGLNVAASRKTTGNHRLFTKLEEELAHFFEAEAAVLVSNGYLTNLVVAQALAGEFTHVLIDERAHGCLFDASSLMQVPVLRFPHRDSEAAAKTAQRLGRSARLILFTDGLYSHSGEVAPLDEYLRVLPKSAKILVDDAHGSGILGTHGRGTAEHLAVPTERLIRTVTLSKAFGAYGGAIVGPQKLRDQIIARSRVFAGNTPLPLPLAAAGLVGLKRVRRDGALRQRLARNTSQTKAALREAGLPVSNGPGPIVALVPRNAAEANHLRRRLLKAGVHPPLINYLGGPADAYFRFVISSEHTDAQLRALIQALTGGNE